MVGVGRWSALEEAVATVPRFLTRTSAGAVFYKLVPLSGLDVLLVAVPCYALKDRERGILELGQPVTVKCTTDTYLPHLIAVVDDVALRNRDGSPVQQREVNVINIRPEQPFEDAHAELLKALGYNKQKS